MCPNVHDMTSAFCPEWAIYYSKLCQHIDLGSFALEMLTQYCEERKGTRKLFTIMIKLSIFELVILIVVLDHPKGILSEGEYFILCVN